MKPKSRPSNRAQREELAVPLPALAHKLKRPISPLTDRKFSLVGIFALLVHPSSTGSREKEFPAHLVLAFGSSDPPRLFFLVSPQTDHSSKEALCHPKQSTTFIVLPPQTPTEISDSCIEIHSFFCIQKRLHIAYSVVLFRSLFGSFGSLVLKSEPTASTPPQARQSQRARGIFISYIFHFREKQQTTHIRRPAVVPREANTINQTTNCTHAQETFFFSIRA